MFLVLVVCCLLFVVGFVCRRLFLVCVQVRCFGLVVGACCCFVCGLVFGVACWCLLFVLFVCCNVVVVCLPFYCSWLLVVVVCCLLFLACCLRFGVVVGVCYCRGCLIVVGFVC